MAELAEKRGGAAKSVSQAKQPLKLWLRLLTCSNIVEKRVREHLRREFDTTLPRFDVMATLEHAAQPLTMGELSAQLMVSNGNVTGIVARLEKEGLIARDVSPDDRRTYFVRLTTQGLSAFREMAVVHEAWINAMFSHLSGDDVADLLERLGDLRHSLEATNGEGR